MAVNDMSTAKIRSVTDAPRVVLNFSSPRHVRLTDWPKRSNCLKVLESLV